MTILNQSISKISGIGPAWQKKLARFDIKTVKDLLWHFPFRYDDYSKISNISEISVDEIAVLKGQIISINTIKTPRKRIFLTQAILEDPSGHIKLVWFNQPFIKRMIKKGANILIAGKVVRDRYGLSIQSPEYEILKILPPECHSALARPDESEAFRGDAESTQIDKNYHIDSRLRGNDKIGNRDDAIGAESVHIGRIVPVYPETKGLTSKMLRRIIWPIINQIYPVKSSLHEEPKGLFNRVKINDYLPESIKKENHLIDLNQAIRQIHFPDSFDNLKKARKRLGFDEMFLIQLKAQIKKIKWQKNKALKIKINKSKTLSILKKLSYRLTLAQKKALSEIILDLSKTIPMNRLLQGDVGSGKTVVVAIAMANAGFAGYQSVFMAPTEVLAIQHFETFKKLFKNFDLKIALLTSSKAEVINPNRCHSALARPVYPKDIFGDAESIQIDKNYHIDSCRSLPRSAKRGRNDIQGGNVKRSQDGNCVCNESSKQNNKIPRHQLKQLIKSGKIQIIIGTHALISKDMKYKNLSLVIVDEQHRFGVKQRAHLRKQNKITPHFLAMTATPIPRTLSLAVFGDLDLSIIDEKPKNRQKVITRIIPPKFRNRAYQFIRKQVKSGRQVFVICPLIERTKDQASCHSELDSESIQIDKNLSWIPHQVRDDMRGGNDKLDFDNRKAATEEYEKLSKGIFPDLKIGLLHGKLKSKIKNQTMAKFKNHQLDILVSTAVVEVGVDVPNASVMMIEGAERFGLAQLHQFRGRVGRDKHQSYCLLFSDPYSFKSNQRLKSMEKIDDGFKLAEIDLKLRGPGEVYGLKQSGYLNLKIAKLTDSKLIALTKHAAEEIVNHLPKYPKIIKLLFGHFEE